MRVDKNKKVKSFSPAEVCTRSNRGFALVMTLVIISMVALLVVGVMMVVRLESAAASNHLEKQRANAVAAVGEAVALGKIRAALDPFQIGQYNGRFWSMEPGRIAIFNTSAPTAAPDFVNLISALPTGKPLTEVDLNRQSFGGSRPIAQTGGPGGGPPSMPIGWTVVLDDPRAEASQTNQMVGRYAFWVDDESSKVNINIANVGASSTMLGRQGWSGGTFHGSGGAPGFGAFPGMAWAGGGFNPFGMMGFNVLGTVILYKNFRI
jgi:type II secretory pathway pseudopilin PulG